METVLHDHKKGSLGYHLFPSATGLPQIDEQLNYRLSGTSSSSLSRSLGAGAGHNDFLKISRSIDNLGASVATSGLGMQRKRSNVSLASSTTSSSQLQPPLQMTPAPTPSPTASSRPQSHRRAQHRLFNRNEDGHGYEQSEDGSSFQHVRLQHSPREVQRYRRRIVYHPTADQVLMHLVHAKQQLRQANTGSTSSSEAVTAQIAAATQRIEVADRAEKMRSVLEEFAPFMEAKTCDLGRKEKVELAGRMAAVCLMSVRRAVQQGTVADLGIDWELVKCTFRERLHREILEDDISDVGGIVL